LKKLNLPRHIPAADTTSVPPPKWAGEGWSHWWYWGSLSSGSHGCSAGTSSGPRWCS